MRIQRITQEDGVKGRYVPGVGATHPSGVSATADAALVAPAPAHHVSRKYLTRIFHASVLDTNRINSGSIADLYRNRDSYTQDHNYIDRRTP
jgi:hypothetical protein